MLNLTEQQIKEIADQLDCGFRCFCHRESDELIFIPDTMRFPDMDTEAWSEEQEKLDKDFTSYFEIEQLQSSDSFHFMSAFAEQLQGNEKLKANLLAALDNKRPFSNFNLLIHNSGIYRQHWFEFKTEKLIEWIKEKLENEKRFQLRKQEGSQDYAY